MKMYRGVVCGVVRKMGLKGTHKRKCENRIRKQDMKKTYGPRKDLHRQHGRRGASRKTSYDLLSRSFCISSR